MMALSRVRPNNSYAINRFQDSATTIVVSIDKGTGCIMRVNDTTHSEIPWQEGNNTESELRQIRLMNIPTRGFCISADEERITAESYRYLYDPEEFETPEI